MVGRHKFAGESTNVDAVYNQDATLSSVMRHICTCTSVKLLTEKTNYKKYTRCYVPIDVSAFRLSTDSFLYRLLIQLPCPFAYTNTVTFRRVLRQLEDNPTAVEVFARPIEELAPSHLNALFTAMEDVLDRTRGPSSYNQSRQARSLFIATMATFPDGRLLNETGFRTRFSDPRKAPKDSDAAAANAATALTPNPITATLPLDFESFDERNKAFLKQKTDAKKYILSLCQRTFDNHFEVVRLLEDAANQPQACPSAEYLRIKIHKLPDETEQLRIIVPEIDRQVAQQNGINGINLSGLRQLHKYQVQATPRYTAETLLSRHYLPRIVLIACSAAIMTDTAWNLETTLSLTPRNIRISDGKYYFVGIKGRTNSIQEIELDIQTPSDTDDDFLVLSTTARQAVDLLLHHAAQIEKYSNLQNPSLFLSYNRKIRGPLKFDRFDFGDAFAEFWKYHNVEDIKPTHLRQLAAHIDYLSPGGNIFSTQALLQHADPDTTADYLRTTLIARLLEENSRRFMKKMEATTLFITGREGLLVEKGLSSSDIQKHLFPATTFSDEPNIADEWLKNIETKIDIGMDELKHCAYQFHYYITNYEQLISENPHRFALVQLPRILFCLTLRRVILASPHAGLYRSFERCLS